MPDVYLVFALLCLVALIAVALGLSALRIGRKLDTLDTAHAAALAALQESNARADQAEFCLRLQTEHSKRLVQRVSLERQKRDDALRAREEMAATLDEWRAWRVGPVDGRARAN